MYNVDRTICFLRFFSRIYDMCSINPGPSILLGQTEVDVTLGQNIQTKPAEKKIR